MIFKNISGVEIQGPTRLIGEKLNGILKSKIKYTIFLLNRFVELPAIFPVRYFDQISFYSH